MRKAAFLLAFMILSASTSVFSLPMFDSKVVGFYPVNNNVSLYTFHIVLMEHFPSDIYRNHICFLSSKNILLFLINLDNNQVEIPETKSKIRNKILKLN